MQTKLRKTNLPPPLALSDDPPASDEASPSDQPSPLNSNWRLIGSDESPETTEEAAEGDPAGEPAAQSFQAPEERYVYEYVYGIICDEYTIASSDGYPSEGALVSATQGQILDDGVTVHHNVAELAINGTADIIPFKRDGKYGLLDYPSKSIVKEPQYDIASIVPGGQSGNQWGFISLGAQADDGTYPQAIAVICSGGAEAFKVNLPGYIREGYISYSSYQGEACWYVGWQSDEANGGYRDKQLRITESADGFTVANPMLTSSADARTFITPDGHQVVFRKTSEGPVAFTVTDPDGTHHEVSVLETDQSSLSAFSTVSNLIKVSQSGGFSYQYFTLDGSLLQNRNGQGFEELGNYVSYERPAFDTQARTQVFLSTVDEGSEEIEIPALASSFPSQYISNGQNRTTCFECITPDNRIKRYDTELNEILEFDAAVDMATRQNEGCTYFNWSIMEPFEGAYLVTESTGYTGWPVQIVESAVRLMRGGQVLDHAALGLDSSHVSLKGVRNGFLYLMDDSGSHELRFYDDSLSCCKVLDLASHVPADATSVQVGLSDVSGGSLARPDLTRMSIQYRIANDSSGSQYVQRTFILDPGFGITDYADLRFLTDDVYAAKVGDKWGFVDSSLAPRSAFIYDSVYRSWYQGDANLFCASIDGKTRVFDEDLNDVFGFAFDTFSVIGTSVYLMEYDGDSHIYAGDLTDEFQEVSLRGYKLADQADNGASRYRARVLPDGSVMLYVKDAQGYVGAVDDAGRVIIPFQFEDFAEDTGVQQDSDYIMLKDTDGWFFVAVSSLQAAPPNEDCDTLGHDFEDVVYSATCTTNGYVQHVCKRCGYAYRDEASGEAALGHDFQLTSEAVAPTCTEDGHEDEYTCSRCGETQGGMRLPNLGGHEWDKDDVRFITYPTCTEDGLYEYSCTKCGELIQEAYPAYGHSWSGPEWTWSDGYQSASARYTCSTCGVHEDIEAAVTHEEVADGVRHAAVIKRGGIDVKDGRMTLGWTDENGIARSLLVKGAPVADGFYAWPQGLSLPADSGTRVEIDVVPVTYGGVFDALVSKIGDGWPAGTFDVRLNIDGTETHEGFGVLTFAFPAGPASANKKAIVHHCHQDDRDNITSHEAVVTPDGLIVLSDITDLSTFILEVLEDDAFITNEEGGIVRGQVNVGGLPATGDEQDSVVAVILIIASFASAVAGAVLLAVARKRKMSLRQQL